MCDKRRTDEISEWRAYIECRRVCGIATLAVLINFIILPHISYEISNFVSLFENELRWTLDN